MSNQPPPKSKNQKNPRPPAVKSKGVRHVVDPFFKSMLTDMAHADGLTHGPTELQIPRSSLSDMLLLIPDGAKLRNPLLALMRACTIIEFKGQNDTLDVAAFDLQIARVQLWHSQNSALADYDRILNLIVSSRYPDAFFKYSASRGCPFEQVDGQEWLWQAQYGWQTVMIVVCENLPVAKPFYRWLAFAPSNNRKWHDFVTQVVAEDDWDLINFLLQMRGEEVYMNLVELEEELKKYHPTEWAEVKKNRAVAAKNWIKEVSQTNPQELAETLATLKPAEVLANFKPEDRLAGLSDEEIQKLLKRYSNPS